MEYDNDNRAFDSRIVEARAFSAQGYAEQARRDEMGAQARRNDRLGDGPAIGSLRIPVRGLQGCRPGHEVISVRFWILLPVAVLAACGLMACGSSAPPSAVSVLKSDGYSSVLNETPAVIKSSFGPAAPYITSAAAGEKGANAVEEVVVGGNAVDGVTGTSFFAALESGLRLEFPSAKVSVTGDILQITASSLSDITGGKS
jgi:hypothetical protein